MAQENNKNLILFAGLTIGILFTVYGIRRVMQRKKPNCVKMCKHNSRKHKNSH